MLRGNSITNDSTLNLLADRKSCAGVVSQPLAAAKPRKPVALAGGTVLPGPWLPKLRSGMIAKKRARSKKNGSSRGPAKTLMPPLSLLALLYANVPVGSIHVELVPV